MINRLQVLMNRYLYRRQTSIEIYYNNKKVHKYIYLCLMGKSKSLNLLSLFECHLLTHIFTSTEFKPQEAQVELMLVLIDLTRYGNSTKSLRFWIFQGRVTKFWRFIEILGRLLRIRIKIKKC